MVGFCEPKAAQELPFGCRYETGCPSFTPSPEKGGWKPALTELTSSPLSQAMADLALPSQHFQVVKGQVSPSPCHSHMP